ncbi:galactose-1-phosphate uridylyltransferase [Nitrospira moscoviensis]|uniref:Galactose-1-phosphate uridylyltransferase n=1 Tax=Nitrospira moscoviensis TaxID=42253 RepID=A0A0K2GE47_NITMO|nr:galactose-1-phosphate uridylyltransferase [Nitrospira moscoviensis]ALA59235.1 Galactose-1-phosphate uridylyltransferase [Nitrospira moscoviensis]
MRMRSAERMLHKEVRTKADGRRLILYGREPVTADGAPSPSPDRIDSAAHFRWHPFRGEWVAYAAHRQHRTFLPPPDYNPLAPTADPAQPTEVPAGNYDVAVFENRFPTMHPEASEAPASLTPTRPALGVCEVVVYTQDPSTSLGALPVDHIDVVLEALADRYRELGGRPDIAYVMPFENRGVEVGVTLHHPHGQLYAFPFIPPVAAVELGRQADYYRDHGAGLLQAHIDAELRDGRRMLFAGNEAVGFVPSFARYAYEAWIAPRRAAPSLAALAAGERRDVARALKTVLLKYDGLWNKPMPYVMVFHQAPTDGKAHPEAHLHIECYPAYRMPGRLKYLAGSELGAGVFTSDTLPEAKAADLQAVQVDLGEGVSGVEGVGTG